MERRTLTENERNQLVRWDRFCTEQSGVYPATIAAMRLRMSPAGVYQAAQRGWISFFQVGRDRWYSRKDVLRYAEHLAMKKNMRNFRSGSPRDCSYDDDGGKARSSFFTDI